MSVGWESVYVFISSTFNDMHAERDYLVKQVFPRLHDWCERRKLRLVDIDLRWGVTEADATHNKNVVQVCLDRIDECRPFFLCFLGQRYGWIPKPEDIDEATFRKFPGLTEAVAAQSSVTDIEVLHSAMRPFHSPDIVATKGYHPADYAFFYLRDDGYLSDMPDEPHYRKRIYTDSVEQATESREFLLGKQRTLREVTIPATVRPTRSYTGSWLDNRHTPEIAIPPGCPSLLDENQARWRRDWRQYGSITIPEGGVEVLSQDMGRADEFNRSLTSGRVGEFISDSQKLGDIIFDDLTTAISQRYPAHTEIESENDLQKELDQQEQFLFINSEGFIERGDDFEELDAYVSSDSRQMFVLTAEAGMGKSMLLANWVDRYRQQIEANQTSTIHCRFVGTSDGSTSLPRLLHYLLRELAEVAGKIDVDEKIPDDPNEIRTMWREQFARLGESGKTVIVIDALNQLESGLSDLFWLPRELPQDVKLIVSFKTNEEAGQRLLESYEAGGNVILSSVKPFDSDEDRRKLVRKYLDQYLKELDEQHIESLIQSPGAHNPLYLKVVLAELRVFGAFSSLGEKIASDFGDTPQSAFDAVLKRLETDPAYSSVDSTTAVPLLFGLIAHARRGLSVEELTELFRLDLGWDDGQRAALQDSVELCLRQVRPFLARRDGRHDFFYESFLLAARDRYVATGEAPAPPGRTTEDWHTSLAHFFHARLNPIGEAAWSGECPRSLTELPYHQIQGKCWAELETTLTSI